MPVNGRAGETGTGPGDIAITGNGRFLYILNNGSHTISTFEVLGDGALRQIPTGATTPTGANGLVAR